MSTTKQNSSVSMAPPLQFLSLFYLNCEDSFSCVVWLQNVADLGSSFQSAQQKQLSVIERLNAVASDCSSVNSSVLSYNEVIMSLSARLTDVQAVVNETLVSCCCTFCLLLQ